ncbi:unnamed protein product [Cyclocybe aegerita]|uniref:Uncharacterized protein n=1 Tax=Cyclocybe aegerita TaxID=1973307 RepID=A0A8S0W5W3_CYCAE|nr:unnamed protein product [Cyclocybe aegerita]
MFRPVLARPCIRRRCTITPPRLASRTQHTPTTRYAPPATEAIPARPPDSAFFVFLKQYLKYTLTGIVVCVATAGTIWEGTHLLAEHVAMAPEIDSEINKWEWDVLENDWTGDPLVGGTDPSLGFWARHFVRAAWMFHYEERTPKNIVGTADPSKTNQEPLHRSDERLNKVENNLRDTIQRIEASPPSSIRPHTLPTLLLRHAEVLEHFGTQSLQTAIDEYERAWSSFTDPVHKAYIAWKLGNANSRLDRDFAAREWWSRSVQLCQSSDLGHHSAIPKSPLAQRILFSTLVSQSAHLARSGKLQEAQGLEESTLALLRSIQSPATIASATPPESLHFLYLLQRSSLLSIHLAEVLHAQNRPTYTSVQWLTSAAESSERVARALTIPQLHLTDSDQLRNTEKLLPSYSSSKSMNVAASELLKDARRTAADAWNLMGILHETQEGTKSRSALNCFEHAVRWASTGNKNDNKANASPADYILESDWNIYWDNYERVKSTLEKSDQK